MKQLFIVLALMFGLSSTAFALPTHVKMTMYKSGGVYKLKVEVRGGINQTRVWPVSPGRRSPVTRRNKFRGVLTPQYFNKSLNGRIESSKYVSSRGDKMPFAMFISGGFALHAGHVTGKRASHGCIRLRYGDAAKLNQWVREAFRSHGSARITVVNR